MDNRAVTPVVEKVLAAGIVMLYIAGTTTVVFGGAVPAERNAVGSELAERTVTAAAEEIERAIPPDATGARVRKRVRLPPTIRGAGYRIRVENRTLVLDHPDSAIEARARLSLPPSVVRVAGDWQSGGRPVVVVRRTAGGLVVELQEAR